MKKNKKTKGDDMKDTEQLFVAGDIFGALKKMKVDPAKSDKRIGEYISIMLDDDELKYAFAKACEKQKQSPKVMLKKIVTAWLKERGYYE